MLFWYKFNNLSLYIKEIIIDKVLKNKMFSDEIFFLRNELQNKYLIVYLQP